MASVTGTSTASPPAALRATAGGQGGSIGLGFAIPVDQARRIADELAKTGKATQAIIGVQVSAKDTTAGGATVVEVTAGGPAEKAGLPKGAVVTKVDDRVVTNGDSLIAAIRSHAPGDTVKLTYTITEIDPVKRQSKSSIEVKNQHGDLVAVGTHILRWVKNPSVAKAAE